MKLANLLERQLKDDDVVELLELFDIKVKYEMDRLHENTPDSYSAESKKAGFSMRFDADQRLKTIWCYIQPAHKFFKAIDPDRIGVPVYATLAEATQAAQDAGLPYTLPKSADYSWIRIEDPDRSRHYEYQQGKLSVVTIMAPE